jgi:hypothetical protein
VDGIVKTGTSRLLHYGQLDASSGGWVDGTLVRKFPNVVNGMNPYNFRVGSGGLYSPVYFVPNASAPFTDPTYIAVTAIDTTMPGLLPATSATRYWKLEEFGNITAQLSFQYAGADIRGDEENYKLWYNSGSGPAVVPGFMREPSFNFITTPLGITNFTGDWGIGEQLDPGPVSISGTVTTSGGQPIRNATVTITGGGLQAPIIAQTGTFGTYSFNNLQAGETYTVRVDVKRYRFTPATQMVTPLGNVANVNFVANPQE